MDELAAIVEEELHRADGVGAAVSVVHEDRVLLSAGFGSRNLDAGLPVTEHTLFGIGSSTKAFTATVIASLVDDGLLAWDTPVREYIPTFRLHDPVATQLMTPRDLLCHRSGLPRHDLVWYNNTQIDRAEAVRRLQYLEPSRSFRQTFQYNNLMYLTAGHLAEVILGCSWEEAVTARILEPLGMTRTNFSTRTSQTTDDFAVPYCEREGKTVPVDFREVPLCGPAGSINSCAADLARWIQVQCEGGSFNGTQVISESALRQLHAPAMVMPESAVSWPEVAVAGYGLGWMIEHHRGRKLLHHGGAIDGFSAIAAFAPQERIGVVVLANSNSSPVPTVVVYRIMAQLMGLEDIPWGERYKEIYDAMKSGPRDAAAHQKAKASDLPPTRAVDDFAGTYEHPGYGTFGITVEDGSLAAHFNDLDIDFIHRHRDTWDATVQPLEFRFSINFAADPDGNVASLAVPMEAAVAPIVFTRQADAGISDPAVLAAICGAYELGPLTVRIGLKGDATLTIAVPGQGEAELESHRGGLYRIKRQPAVTVEFLFGDGGTVTGLAVQPMGLFTRVVD